MLLVVVGLMALPAVSMGDTVTLLFGDCATPKTVFNLGETVCARVSGAPTDGSVFIQIFDPTPAVRFGGPGTPITTDPQNFTYTLPTTGAGAEFGRWFVMTTKVGDPTFRAASRT